jgi:hypothetical protein
MCQDGEVMLQDGEVTGHPERSRTADRGRACLEGSPDRLTQQRHSTDSLVELQKSDRLYTRTDHLALSGDGVCDLGDRDPSAALRMTN